MKTVLFATIALFSMVTGQVASARSIDRTPVVASIHGSEAGIVSATVLEDGRFVIEMKSGEFHTETLNQFVLNDIVQQAGFLATVEIVSIRSQMVCMMMPIAALNTLQVGTVDVNTGRFEPLVGAHTVLNPQGCYNSNKIRPKDENEFAHAQSLMAQLKILALNYRAVSAGL